MVNDVLVINCGSSSLKFAVIDAHREITSIKGNAEALGQENATLSYTQNGKKYTISIATADHASALQRIVGILKTHRLLEHIKAIGHRVVHGGTHFSSSVIIDARTRDLIARCSVLAPLHNPAHVIGIDAAQQVFANLAQVAVFDTAFHQHMPEKAFRYPLPKKLSADYHIRRYGFHGTSYRYVMERLTQLTDKPLSAVIICHLGNGGSVAAVKDGRSVDTTMGLTPLEGLVHGTRSGDIDPAIIGILHEQFSMPLDDINQMLWQQSGLLGLSGLSNDCRTLEQAMHNGHDDARLALEIYCYRLAKHIAAQMVALEGCEALVFTAGIGENSAFVRAKTIDNLRYLGFAMNKAANNATIGGKSGLIASACSKPIWVIATDEELMIARDAARLVTLALKDKD